VYLMYPSGEGETSIAHMFGSSAVLQEFLHL